MHEAKKTAEILWHPRRTMAAVHKPSGTPPASPPVLPLSRAVEHSSYSGARNPLPN